MKPIAVQLYTLRERFQADMVGTLKDIAAIGYKAVEPAGMKGHNPPAEFGPVPLWWWVGETLEKPRLAWQLDQHQQEVIWEMSV